MSISQRRFDSLQRSWDNMTPPEYDDDEPEEDEGWDGDTDDDRGDEAAEWGGMDV